MGSKSCVPLSDEYKERLKNLKSHSIEIAYILVCSTCLQIWIHIRIGRVSVETHKTYLKKFPLSPLLCAILHVAILYVVFRLPVCLAAVIQRIWNSSRRRCSGTCIMLFAFPPSTRNSPSLRDIKKSYVASLEPIKIIPTSALVRSLLDKCDAHWVQGCIGKTQKNELKQWFAEHSFLSVCLSAPETPSNLNLELNTQVEWLAVLIQFPEVPDSILDPQAGHSNRSLQWLS